MSKTKEELLFSLNSEDESERLYAVEDILDSDYRELSTELIRRLQIEKSGLIKNSIISVLQKMEYPGIYKELFELFPKEDPFLRNSAVSIFASYGENSVTYLSSYIDHSNKEVRKLVMDSLVEIALKNPSTKNSIMEILRAHLFDPEINIVITAVEYLGKLEDENSIQQFTELFQKHHQEMLRSTILDVMTKIGKKENIEKSINSLLLPEVINNPLYYPYIIQLLAIAGKKDDFLSLLNQEKSIDVYAEEVLRSLDILFNYKIIEDKFIIEIVTKLMLVNTLSEEIKFASINLLLRTKNSEVTNLLKTWSLKGSNEFKEFCNEILLKQGKE